MFSSSSYGAGRSSSSSHQQSLRKRMSRPRCPLCGSRRYRRDPDTSMIVCDQGHVLQGFREEQADDGEQFTNPQSLSQRTRRTLRKQDDGRGYIGKKRRSTAVRGIWSSERARYLFYQCLQLILRMQLQSIKDELPHCPLDRLEEVCRDLWAFYVSMQTNLQAQPFIEASHDLEMMKEYEKSKSSSFERQKQAERLALLEEEEAETQQFDDQLRSMGLNGNDDDGEETDADRSELSETESRRGNDMSEDGWTSNEENIKKRSYSRTRRSKRGTKTFDGKAYIQHTRSSLTMLVCIIYLGLITLRVPVKWNDLRNLIVKQKLPFLHAVYLLPLDMTNGLPHRYATRLDGKRVPSIKKLHNMSLRLSADLYNSSDITFPDLNALPILWNCTREMLLPPTIYCASKRLLSYCNIPMHAVQDYCSSSFIEKEQKDELLKGKGKAKKSLKDKNVSSPILDGRLTITLQDDSIPREVVLMAIVVLVAKMRYGLDGEERYEEPELKEYWSGCPPLDRWLAALEEQKESVNDDLKIADPNMVNITEMDGEQLDQYLDFTEKHLIRVHHPNAFHRRQRGNIDDLLSCGSMLDLESDRTNNNGVLNNSMEEQKNSIITRLYQDGENFLPTRFELEFDDLRPGDAHSIFHPSIKAGLEADPIHSTYIEVLRHAAHFVGCTPNQMADTVNAVEIRLIKMIQFRKLQRN